MGRGFEEADDGRAARFAAEGGRDGLAEIGAPFAEIVVDVDDGDFGGAGAFYEFGEAVCHRTGMAIEQFAVLPLHVVDDVYEEEGDGGFVGDVAVEVGVAGGHNWDRNESKSEAVKTAYK